MRKFRISLLTLALAACAFGAQAAGPEIETLAGRARDLFDYGRWSDARQEFLRVRAALTPSDRLLAQEADFYLAACAVELGSPDAEGALREFAERYPESVYANDVRFALGSFYCAAGNMEKAREAMKDLQKRGFTILMDDFGSGYSSLNVLKDIAVDVLKIDMKFMSDTEIPGRGENILASVVNMAKVLEMPVIAEGVEKESQVRFLKNIGCEYVQGYYYAKPMPAEEYEKMLFRDEEQALG